MEENKHLEAATEPSLSKLLPQQPRAIGTPGGTSIPFDANLPFLTLIPPRVAVVAPWQSRCTSQVDSSL